MKLLVGLRDDSKHSGLTLAQLTRSRQCSRKAKSCCNGDEKGRGSHDGKCSKCGLILFVGVALAKRLTVLEAYVG